MQEQAANIEGAGATPHFEGYKCSLRRITPEELQGMLKGTP